MHVSKKPHLTYMKQLETLSERGMDIGDPALCLEELKRLGYYRLSAYSYPFRRLLPEERRESSTNYRSEEFVSGTTFGTVVRLADFDSDLRRLIFEALEQIEVVLRTKVAYRVGREDAFIHKNRSLLDDDRCSSKVKSGGHEVTRWNAWKSKFNLLMKQAKNEDFYKHFEEKYQGKMPIWVVIEFVDLGGLTRFYYLLRSKLQSAIARRIWGLIRRDIQQLAGEPKLPAEQSCSPQSRVEPDDDLQASEAKLERSGKRTRPLETP